MGIKVGDKVRVLNGQFANKTGVVVGIIACNKDYSDPYYEVDMDCQVPNKYKCRKTLITPNNVVGGFNAHDFEVIGNVEDEAKEPKIKVGDRVRNIESGLIGVVDKIVYGNVVWVNGVDGKRYHWKSDGLELVQSKKPTEEKQPTDLTKEVANNLSNVLEGCCNAINNIANNFDWEQYTADLAYDIAVKIVNKNMGSDPEVVGEYSVKVAKSVVEELKRK